MPELRPGGEGCARDLTVHDPEVATCLAGAAA